MKGYSKGSQNYNILKRSVKNSSKIPKNLGTTKEFERILFKKVSQAY